MENSIGHRGCPRPPCKTTPAVRNSQSQTTPTRATAPRVADSLKDCFLYYWKKPTWPSRHPALRFNDKQERPRRLLHTKEFAHTHPSHSHQYQHPSAALRLRCFLSRQLYELRWVVLCLSAVLVLLPVQESTAATFHNQQQGCDCSELELFYDDCREWTDN